jgi:hypothetical protein
MFVSDVSSVRWVFDWVFRPSSRATTARRSFLGERRPLSSAVTPTTYQRGR